MIKLNRNRTPLCLNPKYVLERVQEFKKKSKNVWNIKEVKETLLDLSNRKCAYCECELDKEGSYMQVEHFRNKHDHPSLVLDWDNLLPSCKRCNVSKGSHDVDREPIVDPFKDNPSNHLNFRLYRLNGSDEKGKNTVDVLNLNSPHRMVLPRFEIGEKLQELIKDAESRFDTFFSNQSSRNKNSLMNLLEGILLECQPESEYSATCSTILHSDEIYKSIKKKMLELNLWTDELEVLDKRSMAICLR